MQLICNIPTAVTPKFSKNYRYTQIMQIYISPHNNTTCAAPREQSMKKAVWYTSLLLNAKDVPKFCKSWKIGSTSGGSGYVSKFWHDWEPCFVAIDRFMTWDMESNKYRIKQLPVTLPGTTLAIGEFHRYRSFCVDVRLHNFKDNKSIWNMKPSCPYTLEKIT